MNIKGLALLDHETLHTLTDVLTALALDIHSQRIVFTDEHGVSITMANGCYIDISKKSITIDC